MTSSNGNIFRVTGPLCGEFTGPGEFPTQRPVTRSFGALFDLRLNKRLSKQAWGWWFETPSWSLWRQRNEVNQTDPNHKKSAKHIRISRKSIVIKQIQFMPAQPLLPIFTKSYINSSRPNDTYLLKVPRLPLVQMTACHLFGTSHYLCLGQLIVNYA